MVKTTTSIPGSSTISSAAYDPDTQELDITFVTGRTYTYTDVPEDIYQGLINADSAGRYFHREIKGVYT